MGNQSSYKAVDLSIIIVNWHSAEYVIECVRSINENTKRMNYEIIVVDNASYDGCEEILSRAQLDVKYVQSTTNMGFARANNLGADYADGKRILFLNPDTCVRNGAIDKMYERMSMLDKPGVVGCRLLNQDGSLQACCVQPFPTILNQVLDSEYLQRKYPKVKFWYSAITIDDANMPVEVEALSGACMMIIRDSFFKIGGFSSAYFMYGEDLDLCCKTHRAGYRNYYIRDAEIVHYGGGSTRKTINRFSTIMMRESVSRYMRINRGIIYSYGYRIGMGTAAILRMVVLVIIMPIYFTQRHTVQWIDSMRKWLFIFQWAAGLDSWTMPQHGTKKEAVCKG